jgi:hypothetical protein
VNTREAFASTLEEILDDLMPAARRLAAGRRARLRTLRIAAVAACTVGLAASGAAAGFELLGSPAPPAVKRDLLGVDRGMPRDLRLNPDVENAHAVAATDDSVVYFAKLAGGGYCAELVTRADGPRGAVCSTDPGGDGSGMSVTVPYTDPVRPDSPVTVSGRVSHRAASSVELVYPDGGTDSVELGENRFYVADVPARHLAAIHAEGLMLVARDREGGPVAHAVVPSDAITPPTEAERPHDPIELDTVSTERDLTMVLRVRGHVYVDGVARVTLRYPDGETVRVALTGRRFDYAVPPARRRDFMAPGTVTALNREGHVVAERPVAAVAYWHSRSR